MYSLPPACLHLVIDCPVQAAIVVLTMLRISTGMVDVVEWKALHVHGVVWAWQCRPWERSIVWDGSEVPAVLTT